MAAYYNEIDSYAARWLRNLIAAGLIPGGDVDERSIVDVLPGDLRGFRQCHFFAGIGGWSHALRLAGWPDDRPAWTGSCPCQPLSSAGQRKGHADERHFWPAFYRLIAECRPATVIGEQVASKLGREWLAGVRADLEDLGYACRGADLCAAGVSAPHIRQRLYWVAQSTGNGRIERWPEPESTRQAGWPAGTDSAGLADANRRPTRARRGDDGEMCRFPEAERQPEHGAAIPWRGGEAGRWLGDAEGIGWGRRQNDENGRWGQRPSGHSGAWNDCVWIGGRRIGTGIQPLAHGVPKRVAKLRAIGNAIVPPLAAEFIRAFMA